MPERAKSQPSLAREFLAYYRPHVGLLVADTAAALALAGVDLAFPQLLRQLTGGLFTEGPEAIYRALPAVAAALVALYALRYLCRWFVTSWGHIMGARMESAMRQDLFDAYQRFSLGFFDRHDTGELMSRVTGDLFDIAEAAHHGPEWIVICSIEIVGSFVLLALISWQLSAALALVTAALFAFGLWGNARLSATFRDNRRRMAEVNSLLEDSLGGVRVTRAFAGERIESERFAAANDAYLASKVGNYRAMGRFNASVSGFTGVLYVVIVVYGGLLVAQGALHASDLAIYALYVSMFLSPIQTILDFTEMFQKARAGFERFSELLHAEPDVVELPGAPDLEVSEGLVRYEGVSFAYGTDTERGAGGEHVLRDFTLEVPGGRTLALVGPSGGGKSTACALLPRFYDVDAGRILIDGQDVSAVSLSSLRRAVGLVQQDVYLFDGTIRDNIAYGRPGASDAEVEAAARAANIAEFVEGLPEGYDTRVGERGARLSGGQKQRVSIARAFLKDPPILVLDEATSALDNESEHAVQESLARLAEGRTTIVIAHRLSTIRDADEIATVEGGRIVERGTHDELLARGGTYARYHRMQFGTTGEAGG